MVELVEESPNDLRLERFRSIETILRRDPWLARRLVVQACEDKSEDLLAWIHETAKLRPGDAEVLHREFLWAPVKVSRMLLKYLKETVGYTSDAFLERIDDLLNKELDEHALAYLYYNISVPKRFFEEKNVTLVEMGIGTKNLQVVRFLWGELNLPIHNLDDYLQQAADLNFAEFFEYVFGPDNLQKRVQYKVNTLRKICATTFPEVVAVLLKCCAITDSDIEAEGYELLCNASDEVRPLLERALATQKLQKLTKGSRTQTTRN